LITFLKGIYYLNIVKVNMTNKSWVRQQIVPPPESCIAFRVDLPDGEYSLVPESEGGGAEASL
jgi:hypothetical protein